MGAGTIYRLIWDDDPNVVGVYPQIASVHAGYDRNKPSSFDKLSSDEWPSFDPDLHGFILGADARPTDILSNNLLSNTRGLFVSDKAKAVFSKCKMCNVKTFDSNILSRDAVYNYHFVLVIECFDIIDFARSVFLRRDLDDPDRTEKELNIESKEQWINHYGLSYDSNTVLVTRHIALKRNIDLVRLPNDASIHVSERVRHHVENNGLTGAWFAPSRVAFSGPDN